MSARAVAGLLGRRLDRDRSPHARVLVRARDRGRAPGDQRAGDRLPGRARQRLRDLERIRQPLLAGALLRRRGGRHPRPAFRRRTVRGIGARHPAAAWARARARRSRRARRGGRGQLGPAADTRRRISATGSASTSRHRTAREPIPFRVLLDGEAPGPSHGVDVAEEGKACSPKAACTSSCASTTLSASARWRSCSSSPAPRPTCSRSGSQKWRQADQPSPHEAWPGWGSGPARKKTMRDRRHMRGDLDG
jgi:hypothetical protein